MRGVTAVTVFSMGFRGVMLLVIVNSDFRGVIDENKLVFKIGASGIVSITGFGVIKAWAIYRTV